VKLDVVEADGVLRTTEGRTYQLGDQVDYILRIPAGWLYGRANGQPIRLLRPDGSSIALRASVDLVSGEVPAAPVVSADGQRIAWAGPGVVAAGRLTPAGVRDVVSSPASDDAYPLVWVGNRVVLGRSYGAGCCGYRRTEYDTWDPAAGAFVPRWSRDLWPVYGPVPPGAPLVAIHQTDITGRGCLVNLDAAADLAITATACIRGLGYGSLQGRLAPDGRHLAEALNGELRLFDLTTVMTTKSALRRCPGDFALVWEDNNTVIIDKGGSLVRCSVDGTEPTPVPTVRLVPRFG
jgi:hypothetical protein